MSMKTYNITYKISYLILYKISYISDILYKHERLKRRRAEVDAKPKLLCIDVGATCLRGSCASGKVQRKH